MTICCGYAFLKHFYKVYKLLSQCKLLVTLAKLETQLLEYQPCCVFADINLLL